MNLTMSNFGAVSSMTPGQSSFKAAQLNNAANLLRGQSRGISKLQPIVVSRSEIQPPPPQYIGTPQKPLNALDNSLIDVNSQNLSRTIKKANQLPALQTNTSIVAPASLQEQLLGGSSSKMSNISKRVTGCLEPLPSDHQSAIETKIASLRN